MNKQCYLCKSKEKDEVKFGEFMTRGKFSVHYFCLLLTSNLMQNGRDNEGFLGFLTKDIQIEAQRVKNIICCYCKEPSANISCCAPRCHKSFHLTCGEKNSTEHEFVGTFKSYCNRHVKGKKVTRPLPDEQCCICYESIFCGGSTRFDTVKMIRAPCCKNGWFHKYCLAAFAKTAGYFFKCPLCNDNKIFRGRLAYKGIFIPDRDAAWELEPNAFAELLERPNTCTAEDCCAEGGREIETDVNEFLFCSTCGSVAIHRWCMSIQVEYFLCDECVSLTGKIKTSPVVNITPKKNNLESDDEDDEEIDVEEDFDNCSLSTSQTQSAFEEEACAKIRLPLRLLGKRLNLFGNDEMSNSIDEATNKANDKVSIQKSDDEEDEEIVKPLGLINKENLYKIFDDTICMDVTDDSIILNGKCRKRTNRLLSDDFLDNENTSRPCKVQKLLPSSETDSLFDSGAESDRSGSSGYKCNSKSSLENSNSDISDKSDLQHKALVRLKKIDHLEIEKRVKRRFMSLNDGPKQNISKAMPKRCLSEGTETYFSFSEHQNYGAFKTDFIEKFAHGTTLDLKIEKLSEVACDIEANKTLSIEKSETSEVIDEPKSITIELKISPLRLRTKSEDLTKKLSVVPRRRSFIQSPYATPPQSSIEVRRSRRISNSLIKPSRSNSVPNSEASKKHTSYENENNYKQLTGLKRPSSRGRSPLSANLCDAFAYVTPTYSNKASGHEHDKTVTTEDIMDVQIKTPEVGVLFSKSKPNIPKAKNMEITKSDAIPEVKADPSGVPYQNKPVAEKFFNCFGLLFATPDKSKTLKPANKRPSSHKSPKEYILPSNQTKIESFFKRI